VINSCDNSTLLEIAKNCGIDLGGPDTMNENIKALKHEEVTRAALAEASYRQHLNRKLEKQHTLEGENLQLESVNNSQRGIAEADMEKKGGKNKGSKLSRELKQISYK
jgi:hypothetical protein